ncbi:MAG: 30S ribosomal protein S27ae [Candidatus Aenigmatarchaeota archaeon]
MAAEKKEGKKPHSKSKHNTVQIWKKYKDGKIHGKWCPRCGRGVLLAEHKDRVTCGRCRYSEINIKKN